MRTVLCVCDCCVCVCVLNTPLSLHPLDWCVPPCPPSLPPPPIVPFCVCVRAMAASNALALSFVTQLSVFLSPFSPAF